jgi:hypothetical protein
MWALDLAQCCAGIPKSVRGMLRLDDARPAEMKHRYVEALEAQVRKYDELLKRVRSLSCSRVVPVSFYQLHPNEDFTHIVGRRLTRENWTKEAGVLVDLGSEPPNAFAPSWISLDGTTAAIEDSVRPDTPPVELRNDVDKREETITHRHVDDFESTDDEDNISPKLQSLARGFKNMHVGGFQGKSSSAMLIKTMLDVKASVYGQPAMSPQSFAKAKRQGYWSLLPVRFYPKKLCVLLNLV